MFRLGTKNASKTTKFLTRKSNAKSLKINDLAQWSQPGSNRRPPACKAGALPTELWPRNIGDDSRGSGERANQQKLLFIITPIRDASRGATQLFSSNDKKTKKNKTRQPPPSLSSIASQLNASIRRRWRTTLQTRSPTFCNASTKSSRRRRPTRPRLFSRRRLKKAPAPRPDG